MPKKKNPWALEFRAGRDLRSHHARGSRLGSHPSRKLELEPGTWQQFRWSEWTHMEKSDGEDATRGCSWSGEPWDFFLGYLFSGWLHIWLFQTLFLRTELLIFHQTLLLLAQVLRRQSLEEQWLLLKSGRAGDQPYTPYTHPFSTGNNSTDNNSNNDDYYHLWITYHGLIRSTLICRSKTYLERRLRLNDLSEITQQVSQKPGFEFTFVWFPQDFLCTVPSSWWTGDPQQPREWPWNWPNGLITP